MQYEVSVFCRIVLFNIENMYIHFYIFYGSFKVSKLQWLKVLCVLPLSEAYSQPGQTIFAKSFILDIWLGSACVPFIVIFVCYNICLC